MSEGASTMKLLEPRSLAGAERMASRAAMPPLVRSAVSGATGFADRFFQSWLGGERPTMGSLERSPRSLAFPSPWYELPSERRVVTRAVARPTPARLAAPARVVVNPEAASTPSSNPSDVRTPEQRAVEQRAPELRAIDLVLQSAPPAMHVAVNAAPISIAQRSVDQLARVDELLRGVIHTPVSTVELAAMGMVGASSVASLPVGTLGAAPISVGAPLANAYDPATLSSAPGMSSIASSSLSSSIATEGTSSMPLVSRPMPSSQTMPSAAARGIERTLLTPMLVPALSASPVVAAAARAASSRVASLAPMSSATASFAPTSSAPMSSATASFAPTSSASTPFAPATQSSSAASSAPFVTPLVSSVDAASPAPVSGVTASSASSPVSAPYAQGGVASAFASTSPFTPFATSAASRPTVAYAAPAHAPTLGIAPGLSVGPPVVWPRLQSFIERVAGPATLGDAGFVLPSSSSSQSYTRVVDAVSGLTYVTLTSTPASPSSGTMIARSATAMRPSVAGSIAPGASIGAPAAASPTFASASAQGLASAQALGAPQRPMVNASLASTSSSGAAPSDVPTGAASSSAAPASIGSSSSQLGIASPITSGLPFVSPTLGTAFADAYASPSQYAGSTATLAGELAMRAPVTSYRPGRLAQRAELLATIAAQRADRQLGTSVAVEQRSVQWSSDAFTVVALAPMTAAAARAASVARSGAPSFAYAAPQGAAPGQMAVAPGQTSIASGSSSAAPGSILSPSAASATTIARSMSPASYALPSLAAPFASTPYGIAPSAATYAPDAVRNVAPFERALVTPEQARSSQAAYTQSTRGATPFSTAMPAANAFAAQSAMSQSPMTGYAPAMSAGSAAVQIAPLSIASVLAFADSQLGPRLLEGTRPLPVSVPAPVYLQPDDVAAAPTARAQSERRSAPSRTFVAPGAAPQAARGLDLGSDFTIGAYGTLGYAPAQSASPAQSATSGSAAIGQLGRRSEQLAGELGVRVGSLASDFLIDVQPNAEADAPGSTLHAATAGRAWMSTSDWILLSLFPSTTTAHQIAASSASMQQQQALASRTSGRFPLAATVAPSLSSPSLARAAAFAPGAVAPGVAGGAGVGTADGDAGFAPSSALAPALSSLVAPSAGVTASGDEHAPVTAYLPDGRMPRGNRMVARTPALPVIVGAPSSSIATTVAATDRRAASPIGAPLWGHMRQLVEPAVQAPAPTPPQQQGARATAMELVQPYIEAARQESMGASSFQRQATPTVSASPAPDAPTKSLVRALSAQGSAPSNDRLSMADLTLISIVSATEQVAAAGSGPSPDLAPTNGKSAPGAQHATGAGFGGDVDHEIELIAERAYERLMDELRRYNETKGETWEK